VKTTEFFLLTSKVVDQTLKPTPYSSFLMSLFLVALLVLFPVQIGMLSHLPNTAVHLHSTQMIKSFKCLQTRLSDECLRACGFSFALASH